MKKKTNEEKEKAENRSLAKGKKGKRITKKRLVDEDKRK